MKKNTFYTMNKQKYFQFKLFPQKQAILHFVSTKHFGNMSLFTAINQQTVIENRKKLASTLGIDINNFVFQQQVHGTKCTSISASDKGKGVYNYATAIKDNDAMITLEKGICLTAMAGDCVPLLFYEPEQKAIGVAHAGWRGTYKKIAQKTIEKMSLEFGCKPENIIAGIGPSVGSANYEVDDFVYNQFKMHIDNFEKFFSKGKEKGKYYLDLWAANKEQLLEMGLKRENIEISGLCSFAENDLFFSARRGDKERFMAGIMIL
ncbi:MAG: peptidoglycan editing factor PgeF [Bacteroidales bacterium]|nr:peptidoglycan editing factor PgeF [Bacteroidales bacterium]